MLRVSNVAHVPGPAFRANAGRVVVAGAAVVAALVGVGAALFVVFSLSGCRFAGTCDRDTDCAASFKCDATGACVQGFVNGGDGDEGEGEGDPGEGEGEGDPGEGEGEGEGE